MQRSGHHVMVAVPTRGQVAYQTVVALQAARDWTPDLRPIVYVAGNLSVALTRNEIVQHFLVSDCTTLVMVDDDVAPPLNLVDILDPWIPTFGMVALPHATTHPDFPGDALLSVYDWKDGGVAPTTRISAGINTVDCVATGCVAIDRMVLEQLGPAPFRMAHDPTARLRSDDFIFCQDMHIAGFKIGCYYDGAVDHFRVSNLSSVLTLHQQIQQRERSPA